MKTRMLVYLLALAASFLPAAQAAPLLKTGDRMVFLGDSITEQRTYTRYVMNYFTLRYPGAAISFRNAGWSGDTAPGGLNRLQRDVLSLKPNVVSICFGMNDGGYSPFDQGRFDNYMRGMTGLVANLKGQGVTVVLLTPGCIDPDKRKEGNVYNETLTRYAKAVLDLAATEKLASFDLNALMLDVQTRAKAETPAFTMIPDSVHPSPPGQLVMAYALLRALNCAEQASGLAIDASKQECKPDRCSVKDLKVMPEQVTFTRTDEALPICVDPEARSICKYLPLDADLNQYRLTVTGLKAGAWSITADGVAVGTYPADQLAASVNLAAQPGPWQKIGADVNRLSGEQENLYYSRWRQLGLLSLPDELKPDLTALVEKMDRLVADREDRRIKAVPQQRAWNWSLTLVPEPIKAAAPAADAKPAQP